MTDMIPRAEADARVAVAYEAAAKDVSDWGELLCGIENVTEEVVDDIRALTPDDARAALEAMLAEARREERARALDEVSEQWSAALYGMTENGVAALNEKATSELHPEISAFSEWLTDAAIRAEAE